MLRKLILHTKRSIKCLFLVIIAAFLLIGVVAYLYKPTYRVILNGELIGYTENKGKLQIKLMNMLKMAMEKMLLMFK